MLAQFMALYTNVHRGAATPPVTVAQFMPDFLGVMPPPTAPTDAQEQANFLAYARRRGDTVLPPETTDEEIDAIMLADAEAAGDYWSDEENA